MLVGRWMTPDPKTISPSVSVAEATERMQRERVRRFPVVDHDRLLGIVSLDDLLRASPSVVTSLNVWEISYLLNKVTVRDVMTRDVITVTEDVPLEEAAKIMLQKKIGGLPVVRDGHVVGIITESDIFRIFTQLLGSMEPGIRLTILAPYFKGSLAQISSAITQRGGLITAFNVFPGDAPENWGAFLKVAEISKADLIDVITPLVISIVNLKEV
ncbi:MAG TPA: CBS domain-containing protein [Anaerolineae bacterium]